MCGKFPIGVLYWVYTSAMESRKRMKIKAEEKMR